MKKLLILAVASAALYISFAYFPHSLARGQASIGDTVIDVEIADTPEERLLGLSGRDSLKEGQGMLFILDEPGRPGFWMKDMKFAIDIIWIGEDGRVLSIDEGVGPETYPENFAPAEPVKYVLEVPAGFSDTAKIELGEILSIGQENP
jgi:uncharacterized protein